MWETESTTAGEDAAGREAPPVRRLANDEMSPAHLVLPLRALSLRSGGHSGLLLVPHLRLLLKPPPQTATATALSQHKK